LSALVSRELSPLQFHVTIFIGSRKGSADEDDTVRGGPPVVAAGSPFSLAPPAARARFAGSTPTAATAGRFGDSAGVCSRAIGLLSRELLLVSDANPTSTLPLSALATLAALSVEDVRATFGTF
jgi:hypothetical protein